MRRGDRAKVSTGPSGTNGVRPGGRRLVGFWVRAILGAALILLVAVSAVAFLWVKSEDTHRLRQLQPDRYCQGVHL